MALPKYERTVDLPRLEPGDHMSREEFDRRYAQRPDLHKAELVQGVVYVPSPVRIDEHSEPASRMSAWLALYAMTHRGVRSGNDGTVHLSPYDTVQPDIMLWKTGGNARIGADQYLEGAPELVVEIAASSVAYDLHSKKDSYQRAGVLEYIVWRTLDHQIDWFRLIDGKYEQVMPDENGAVTSTVFEGLTLNIPLMLMGDPAAVLPPPAS
jgi:Uma2 family endonuclease